MKLVPWLLLHFLILSTQQATAFPELHLRDAQEIPWGQWAKGAWDLTAGVATAGVGAFGSAWNAGASLFQTPEESDTATTQQNQDVSKTQTDSSATQGDTNPLGQQNGFQLPPDPTLDLLPTPSAEINLVVIGETDPNDPCYPSNFKDPKCDGRPMDRVILTSICENLASSQSQITEAIRSRNLLIESTLTDIDTLNRRNGHIGPGVRKSQSKSYDVLYFLVPLTDKQVDDVNRLDGVYTVEFSQKLVDYNYRESDPALQENTQTPIKIKGRQQNDPPTFDPSFHLETQPNVYPDLGFISTPFKKKTARAYSYESKAGEGVVAWVMNSGVDRDPDFVIEEYRFAQGATAEEVDDLGLGTCYASKIIGLYGVAKKGRLKIMKIGSHLESVADGLSAITDSVSAMAVGFTVIALDQNWVAMGGVMTKVIEGLITKLEQVYQVPIVVKGGDETDFNIYSQPAELNINMLPALWSQTHPLIAVGAVDPNSGARYPWSRGGPFKTISAPGKVRCTNQFKPGSSQTTKGGDFAAAQVTGLLVYLLSSAQYGDDLRKDPSGVPHAIKELVIKLGYVREGTQELSIWNGLDSTVNQFWR